MEPAIFFSGPPNLNELCCLSVCVPISDNLCVMQPHIVRCRELIFTEPDVLASPVLGEASTFHIILQQSLYKTGRLHMRLQKQGMQVS
ncbi:hypothetical protein ElyMa_005624000 [Elysia marginata]|uniref:DUF4708 domain-containing protein n=1 Tax=Elysia marginata TaxID=1093978 RepID=A0AAV4F817_9GAST|nr:hypothetical protein ElyMa_005624000 [Elysia marginata]